MVPIDVNNPNILVFKIKTKTIIYINQLARNTKYVSRIEICGIIFAGNKKKMLYAYVMSCKEILMHILN